MRTNSIKFENPMQAQIMRQVYLVWFFKKALPFVLLEGLILFILLNQVARYVFVEKVLEGFVKIFFSNPFEFLAFFGKTFLKTKTIVQISLIGSSALALILSKNILQCVIQFHLVKNETRLPRMSFHK